MSNLLMICFGLLLYLFLVRSLRYRRAASIAKKHGMLHRADFAQMTADQAQDVLKDLVELEFPKLMGFSIVFALFKTYGIPSISSLLVATGELASVESASRRIADTGVLLLEFCLNKPSSPRALEAITRMNYLHSRYIKAGKISNDDMLYTLSVFALEPARWVNRFEWRDLTDVELCATGTFWKSMGDKMEIDLSPLPGYQQGWLDGLDFLRAIRTWSEEYEKSHMIPHEVNHRLVLAHLDIMFLNVPPWLKAFATYIVSVVSGPRLRRAIMLPPSPDWFESSLLGIMAARRLCLRYATLPRFLRKSYISEAPEGNGRYSSKEYLTHPWYVRPTFSRRWGARAWATRLLGRKLPGDDGNKYSPEGYVVKDVGPSSLVGKGVSYMVADSTRLQTSRPGSCPFKGLAKG